MLVKLRKIKTKVYYFFRENHILNEFYTQFKKQKNYFFFLNINFLYEIYFLITTKQKFHLIDSKYQKNAEYTPARPFPLRPVNESLKYLNSHYLKYESMNFLDIGHGKGRLLYYLNKNLKLNSITGVEINHDYYLQSIKNNKEFKNINLVNADFFEYDIPQNMNVFFFFSPFRDKKLYLRLIEKLLKSKKNFFLIAPRKDNIIIENFKEVKLIKVFKDNYCQINIFKYEEN